jgi:hypothetical protein
MFADSADKQNVKSWGQIVGSVVQAGYGADPS